ncbi:DUF1697 domain-containing protein [Belliella sp. R4-6]|uniref:DUF1697 domain-containing protein n=1 Tax=Belliella alkalica TaxID=1730871 RepID=A0ABS9V735_9BACT|nr:DUF1697 domain-containing protein [Belliella alkalica]MCH7411960.1 DUF1697 domain-containing protein [Belliella alkalica]
MEKLTPIKLVTFLRGINVGGHHKVPMKDLVELLNKSGFLNVVTILNSGNVIFDSYDNNIFHIENQLEKSFLSTFGFAIPTIVISADDLKNEYNTKPFEKIEYTKDTRFYISFCKEKPVEPLTTPWSTSDESFHILNFRNRIITSILDLSKINSPKGMDILEKHFGKDITTRNWNTIEKIIAKL